MQRETGVTRSLPTHEHSRFVIREERLGSDGTFEVAGVEVHVDVS